MKTLLSIVFTVAIVAANAMILATPNPVQAGDTNFGEWTCAHSGGHWFCGQYIVDDCWGGPENCEL